MAKLLVIMAMAAVFVALPFLSKAKSDDFRTLGVFETGQVPTTSYQVDESDPSSPPKSLLLFTPAIDGIYPVIMFLHGTCLVNSFYSQLLQHISSHGFIVVAPQTYVCLNGLIPMLPVSGPAELEFAAEVANWLPSPSGLESVLPENVIPDLNKLAIGGHSRGGKIAFALALGYAKTPLKLKISALAGLDPVEGTSRNSPTQPKVLTHTSQSLPLPIPVAVIGTGLGNQAVCWLVCPACAPDEMNHEEFFNECKSPAVAHFVTTDYGHMDMLNDNITDIVGRLTNYLCKDSEKARDPMRRTVGGIVVAFLRGYFEGESKDFSNIVQQPSLAPARLDPVEFTQE